MVRLKIHDGSPHEPGCLYLDLIETDPDHVMLAVVDERGEIVLDPDSEEHGGGLFTLTTDGRLALSPAVMPSLGFDLDANGRIRLDPWVEKMNAQQAQRYGGKRASFRTIK